MRLLLLIFAALIVAAGTGFYVLQGFLIPEAPVQTTEAVVAAPTSQEVFVPATDLGVGAIILPEHLGQIAIEVAAITGEMIPADDAGRVLLIGSVAKSPLSRGVPFVRSATVQPGDRGFLAAVLPRGKRAIAIPIGEVAGLSGLIFPGDRVDIILTYSVSGGDIDSIRDVRASETVMTGLRVLALDQRLQATPAGVSETGEALAAPIARIATLEVTPRQAEMITLATSLGDLSLVLNSISDGVDLAAADAPASETLNLRMRAVPAGAEPAVLRRTREMTLDSEVTSLLQRQASQSPSATSVQVVRGRKSSGVRLEPGAAGPAAPPVPVAEE